MSGLFALACQSGEITPPELMVTSPERGTVTQGTSVIVEGTAMDSGSGLAEVRVNGHIVAVENGRFSTSVDLESGVNVIEVAASDEAGNTATRSRSVLAGFFEDASVPVDRAATVAISREGFANMAAAASAAIRDAGVAGLFGEDETIGVASDGCFGAAVEVEQLDYRSLDISIEPGTGTITATVAIEDVDFEGTIDYSVVCLNERSPIDVSVDRLDLTLELALELQDDVIDARVAALSTDVRGLTFQVGSIDEEMVELIVGELDSAIGDVVSEQLRDVLVPLIGGAFERASVHDSVLVLGTNLTVDLRPRSLTVDETGVVAEVQSHLGLYGNHDAGFISNPTDLPTPTAHQDVMVMVADDAVNQGLAALWAGGAFSQELPVGDAGRGLADAVVFDALLPPVVGTNGDSVELVLGDVIVTPLLDGFISPLGRVAVTVRLLVNTSIASDGTIHLDLGEPTVQLDSLDRGAAVSDGDLDLVADFVSSMLTSDLKAGMLTVPLPSISGSLGQSASALGDAGYLKIGTSFSAK